MATITLTAKREGSLLSRVFSREITPNQLELVELLLSVTDEASINQLELVTLNLGLTAEMAAALQPVGGIEQYQAEDR